MITKGEGFPSVSRKAYTKLTRVSLTETPLDVWILHNLHVVPMFSFDTLCILNELSGANL